MKIENDLEEIFNEYATINAYMSKQRIIRHMTVDDFKLAALKILALRKPEPLAKNKQTKKFCEWCGTKLTYKVETDINSNKVCRNALCQAK